MTGQIKKWVGLLFILLACRAFGQEYHFQHLTPDMGLSQGNVLSITRDNKGFLWIGTENGLNKFDGYSFTTYHHNPNDPFSISNDMIIRLRVDSQNRLWVTTRIGLHWYDRINDRFIRYKFQGEAAYLNNFFIYDFLFDSASSIWIDTSDGLVKYNMTTQKIENRLEGITDRHLLKGIDINAINKDSKGNLWIVARSGCFKVDFQKKKVIKIIFHDNKGKAIQIVTNDFCEDKNGNFWIATAGQGLFILNSENRIVHWVNSRNSNITNDDLSFIKADTENNIWIGTNVGVNVLPAWKVAAHDYSFINLTHHYYDRQSILSDIITTFYEDKEGRIWIGSRSGGIDYYDKQLKRFNHLYLQPGSSKSLSHDNSTSIVENEKGEIFIGTDGGGIDVFSRDHKMVTPFSKYATFGKLTNKKVIALAFDSKGRLFVGMWGGGVDIFDFKSRKKIHLKKGNGIRDLTSDNIFSLLADRRGNVWIGTFQEGVNRIDPSLKQVIHFKQSESDQNINFIVSILRLYEDKSGDIWMAIDPDGVYKFDYRTGKMSFLLSLNEAPKKVGAVFALSFYEDSKSRFWIGTRGQGLNLYDRLNKKLKPVIINEIDNGDVFGILEDEKGAIWASTNNGISKFIVSDTGHSLAFTKRNFDVFDGLQANQFNLWSAFKSRNGELYFGGVNGVNYFKPQEIVYNTRKPEVVFTGFSIFNVVMTPNAKDSPLKSDISESKTIILNHTQSLFSIEFVGMNFTQPKKNQYKCKLEGFEKNWRYLGTERKVTYTNLDPGTYVLKVLASNNDGLWNDKAATLTIVVLPPWWKETWFKVLALFLFVTLLTFAIWIRFRQLTKHNAELEEKVLIRTEEISKRTEELSKQSLYLETINNELIKSNATKNRLFSIIAHDLRSPFNSLIGIANYLKEYYYELDDTQRHEMISKIEKSSSNFYDLLSNLLLWSMTQKDALKLYPEPVNLLLLIEQAILALKGNIDEKHIQLGTDLSDITIVADNNQIQAIIRNLLSNAIKYSRVGDVISISCRETSTDMVEIKVVDHGVGMSEEIKNHLFDSCQIKSQPGTNNEKGTGLGLTIVYDFVTLHKGSIQVESKSGLGTMFVILLPKQLTQNT